MLRTTSICRNFISGLVWLYLIGATTVTFGQNIAPSRGPGLPWIVVPAASPETAVLKHGSATLRLQACNPNIIRVTYLEQGPLQMPENFMIIPETCPPGRSDPSNELIQTTPVESTGGVASVLQFRTSQLRVELATDTGALTFRDARGTLLLAESSDPGSRTFKASTSGMAGAAQVTQVFRSQSGERFFGLGQHQAGVWNYAGESVELTQDNTNISIPFFVSDRGYGLLWNNGGASRFNNRFAQRLYLSSDTANAIDYYFVYGPELDDAVKGYRQLTGQAPLFSRAAYGFWQSKNRYESQAELVDTAQKYRELGIPIDNIVQDWFWWTKIGSHLFNDKYPDPNGMVERLHALNFHVMISVWPFFQPGTANYDELQRSGHFIYRLAADGDWLPEAALYDPFSGEARSIYWRQIDQALFRRGFDAWWLDTTEPETINTETNALETASTGAGPGPLVANLFPLMTTTAVYQGQRAASQEKRVFILTRSASAGMQRNAAAAWSGDIFSTWDVLRRQIPAGLNFSLSGLPYWTTDIGGFVSGDPDDPAYRELFVRWFEYGAFCPIFRVHGTRTGNRNELWSYGPDAQEILTRFDRLRYRLLPYIYSAAWAVTSRGGTLMRPLAMSFRKDQVAGSVGDQFLFGESLMVSPVVNPGQTLRTVYLPAEPGGWIDFWTGKRVTGGAYLAADAPLAKIPLHVRAGTILPLGPEMQYAGEHPADPIELRIYTGADANFELYEDEGDSYRYEQGAFATIQMHWDESANVLTIGDLHGSFPGVLSRRRFRVVWVGEDHGAGVPPTNNVDREIVYEGRAISLVRGR